MTTSRLRRAARVGWLALSLGLFLAALVYQQMAALNTRDAGEDFERRAQRVHAELSRYLTAVELGLRGLHGLFAGSQVVEREEFRTFVSAQGLLEKYPAVQSVSFVRALERGSLPLLRAAGWQEAAATTGRLRSHELPSGTDSLAFDFVEPPERARHLFGSDLAGEAPIRAAILKARDEGVLSVAGGLRVADDPPDTLRLLLFLPIYRRGEPSATREERRAHFLGAVCIALRLDQVFDSLEPRLRETLDISLSGEDVTPLYHNRRTSPLPQGGLDFPPHPALPAWQVHIRQGQDVAGLPAQLAPALAGFVVLSLWCLLLLGLRHLYLGREQALVQARDSRQALARKEVQLSQALAHIQDVLWTVSPPWRRLDYLSPAVESVFGYSLQAFETTPSLGFDMIVPEDRARVRAEWRAFLGGAGSNWECLYRARRADGQIRWLQNRAQVLRDAEGRPLRMHGMVRDVTALKHDARAALAEKEWLLKEFHHRVKNNLQLISSLLNLQAQVLPPGQRSPFQNSGDRVRALAAVHEALYQSDQFAALDLLDFLGKLCGQLQRGLGREGITLSVAGDSVQLPITRAVPCALLTNELVSNALKHAYPPGRAGEVRVTLHCIDGEVCLQVCDRGQGLPTDGARPGATSLGLQLAADLAAQLKGRLAFHSQNGLCVSLRFPLEPAP
ncbi:MAG: CHASE domain-containing protein [Gammaproteobacteria bacterium]|nr:CHASE domain-containing protein [Gammaproteobacteria bacterium]